ncbi:hypothetical protein Tco_0165047 [Tanacetum coccineum]
MLASLGVPALDKPRFQIENLSRRFIHESNPDDTCAVFTLFRRWSNHLIPAPSDSLPHAHTQASKTYNWHQKFKKSGKLITYKDKDLPRDSKENWYIKEDC